MFAKFCGYLEQKRRPAIGRKMMQFDCLKTSVPLSIFNQGCEYCTEGEFEAASRKTKQCNSY